MTHNTDQQIRVGERIRLVARGKKKTYTADYWYNGRHCRRSLKTSNLKVARQRAARLETQLADGTLAATPKPIKLTDGLESFLTYHRTQDRQPKTVQRYSGILETFLGFCAERHITNMAAVNLLTVDQFQAQRKLVLHPKTMRHEATLLKSFFRWGKQRGLLAHNPLENLQLPRVEFEPRGGPSLDQVQQLVAGAEGARQVQLAVLAFTGMRSGELKRLRVEDVDLQGGWIQIASRPGARTKTGKSRKVPIHAALRGILLTNPKSRSTWYFTAPPSPKYPQGGHGINTKHLNEDFLQLLKKLNLPVGRDGGFTLHSLRHSFETICINAGTPQRVVDSWLGHAPDRSMASVYYKLADEDSQKFMDRVPFGTGEPAA